MNTEKKELFLKAWIVIAYFIMFYIYYVLQQNVYAMEFGNEVCVDSPFVVIGKNIDILAIGLGLFLIPYEYIFSWITELVYDIGDLIFDIKITRKYVEMIFFGVVYIGVYAVVKNCYWIPRWKYGIICCLLTFIATIISYYLYDVFSNKWLRFVVSSVIVNAVNVCICYDINHKFITDVLAYLILMLSWMLYDSFKNKKIDWDMIVASIVSLIVMFACALELTDNYLKWCEYLKPYSVQVNRSSYMMHYLRQKSFWLNDFSDYRDYLKHPFIGFSRILDTSVMIVHIALFISTVVVAIVQIKISAKKNIKRACAFANIFLWYEFVYLYKLMCDMGVLPEPTMTFMSMSFYIPMMAIMIKVLRKGKRAEGIISKYCVEIDAKDDRDADDAVDIESRLAAIEKKLELLERRESDNGNE